MSRARFCVLLAAVLGVCSIILPQTQALADVAPLEGLWQGDLRVSGGEIGLILKISRTADDTYAGTLDVPTQGAKDIPMTRITRHDGQIRLEIAAIGALFTGQLSADGKEIDGRWQQSGLSLPLKLKRIEQAPVFRRPQEPQRPYPYLEEEVAYENRNAGVRLAGTLTLPKSGGPFPAVILITGSGAQDRDESLLGHRPFLVLADYLTRRGIAVLRADDRGIGGSTGNINLATTADLADDVLAGVAYLKSRKEIDPKRIGLIGHSEGGLVAPMAASRSQDIALIVLLAGPGVTGEQIILLQTELIMRANGATEAQITKERALQQGLFAVLKDDETDETQKERLSEMMRTYVNGLSPEERQLLGNVDAFIQGQLQALLSPWFRFFLTYDPGPALQKVACPVLALNGEKDLQVPYQQNLPAIEAALEMGRNKDYTVKSLPGLNHLFQTCTTGTPLEYGAIEETFSPVALQAIGDWIAARMQ